MPLKKLILKPGINQENTRYYSETGWYECDKIRFRQGTPETIGGWRRISANTFLGVCRALFRWVTLGGAKLMGVGTHLKYYIEQGASYYDVTPIRKTTTGTASFTATAGSSVLTVTDVAHGCVTGDFVTFSGAASLGGNVTAAVLDQEYQVKMVLTNDTYTIQLAVTANSSDTGHGGAAVSAAYQINVGPEFQVPRTGWGAMPWGLGPWGIGVTDKVELRVWSQSNFGEDLIFGPRYGGMYYWDPASGVTARAVNLASLPGASNVPTLQQKILVSDVSRFVFAFGCNDYGEPLLDPLLIRWSDQESAVNWTPEPTNQAGSLRLSQGSTIITAMQLRQEIVVWTDVAVYSMQYVGAPVVWGSTLLADNTSCISPNGVAVAANVAYWMGNGKFYTYNGTVSTLNCDLRQYVFGDINLDQPFQVCAGTNEAFNEVWWFYCSKNSTVVDRYVVYNYLENIWYYGTMGRTAWLEKGSGDYPRAATYSYNIVTHEDGVDDNETDTPRPINAYITSAEWDLEDGDHFAFIYRMVPDLTFRGSTVDTNPQATMSIIPMKSSGSGYNNPQSIGGSSTAAVVRTATVPVEEFTGQVYIRVRGRQFVIKIESNKLGTAWQLGAPRVDARPDGRRG